MSKQYLDEHGLETYKKGLDKTFVIRTEMLSAEDKLKAANISLDDIKEVTDPLLFEVDYNLFEFDVDQILSGDETSAILGTGQLGTMILGMA